MMEANTIIISGFPGTGKTVYCNNYNGFIKILDSDSSEFSWIKDKNGNNTKERNPDFPDNYIAHIKDNIKKADIIFVSSHKVVRDALRKAKISYNLVYPELCCKEEYLQRYKNRGNNENFIKFINDNWEDFINDIKNEKFANCIELKPGEFIQDKMHELSYK